MVLTAQMCVCVCVGGGGLTREIEWIEQYIVAHDWNLSVSVFCIATQYIDRWISIGVRHKDQWHCVFSCLLFTGFVRVASLCCAMVKPKTRLSKQN